MMLLRKDAHTMFQDGLSPLVHFIQNDMPEHLRYALEHGADPSFIDHEVCL